MKKTMDKGQYLVCHGVLHPGGRKKENKENRILNQTVKG